VTDKKPSHAPEDASQVSRREANPVTAGDLAEVFATESIQLRD
jgi:hypothetical protein